MGSSTIYNKVCGAVNFQYKYNLIASDYPIEHAINKVWIKVVWTLFAKHCTVLMNSFCFKYEFSQYYIQFFIMFPVKCICWELNVNHIFLQWSWLSIIFHIQSLQETVFGVRTKLTYVVSLNQTTLQTIYFVLPFIVWDNLNQYVILNYHTFSQQSKLDTYVTLKLRPVHNY